MIQGSDDENYCRCGEYLEPGRARCDDPRYGCMRPRPGLHCRGWYHRWIEGGRGWRETPDECKGCHRVRLFKYMQGLEWQNTDRLYWKDIFENVKDRAFVLDTTYSDGGYREPCDPYKAIRDRRYEERRPKVVRGQYPIADYGYSIGGLLQVYIDHMYNDINDSRIDNTRFAMCSSRKDMKRYRARRDRGCCGYHDQEVSIRRKHQPWNISLSVRNVFWAVGVPQNIADQSR